MPMPNMWSHEKAHWAGVVEMLYKCFVFAGNDVLLESAMVGDPSACDKHISAIRRGRNSDVLTMSW